MLRAIKRLFHRHKWLPEEAYQQCACGYVVGTAPFAEPWAPVYMVQKYPPEPEVLEASPRIGIPLYRLG